MDAQTLESWIQRLGYNATPAGPASFRIRPANGDAPDLPPFIVQHGAHWILLSILPVLPPSESSPHALLLRLLSANREMRLVKFALGENGEVVLCAELPTESLDYSELSDAIERMVKYFFQYRDSVQAA